MRHGRLLILALLLVTLSQGAAAQEAKLRTTIVAHRNGSIDFGGFTVENSSNTHVSYPTETEDTYMIRLTDGKETIYSGRVLLSFLTPGQTPTGQSTSFRQAVNKTLWLPYTGETTEIYLEKKQETVASVDLVSELCVKDDGICPRYCRGKRVDPDCSCGNQVCDEKANEDRFCPEDCINTGETEGPEGLGTVEIGLYILIGLAALAAIGYLFSRTEVKE